MIPVHEILHTIQGEGARAGTPCVLVRTLGCNLDCRWCDTDQTGAERHPMEIPQIVDLVLSTACPVVEITGGEPLIHDDTPDLCKALLARGATVLVETNGSLDVSVLPPPVVRIMDLKPPSSGENESILWGNLDRLGPCDEIKMVIADEDDYRWAHSVVQDRLGAFRGVTWLSPLTPGLDPGALASWILRDGLAVRLNVQLHKILFPGGEVSLRIP